MKKILLLVLIACTTLISVKSQKKSEWKVFAYNKAVKQSYIVDEEKYLLPADFGRQIIPNTINDVVVAPNGDTYLATNIGLLLYRNKKISRIKIDDANVEDIYSLAFDSKDNLWIGAYGRLIKYHPNGTEIFTKDSHPNMAIARALEIVVDANDFIWITGRKDLLSKRGAGISYYNGETWTNYQEAFEKPFVEELTIDANGNVWVVYGRQDDGVAMFDGEWQFFNKDNSPLPTNTVRAIASDQDGKVYLGTEKGLSMYDNGEWTKIILTDVFKSKFLTRLNSIQPVIVSLAVDQNNVIWVGTKDDGVFRLANDSRVEITAENSPLTSNSVRRIIIDRNNAKWFLTGYKSENVTDNILDAKSEAELALSYKGAVMYSEPNYSEYEEWSVHNYYTKDLPTNAYYSTVLDNNNKLWMTAGNGVFQFDNNTWSLVHEFDQVNNSPAIAVGADNTIWTSGTHITKINAEGVKAWHKKDNGLGGTSAGLAVDQDGKVWFGNNKGFCAFENGEFSCISKKEGLPDVRINHVFVDSKNTKWVGFYASVGKYDGTSWTEFSKKEGGLTGTYPVAYLERANGEYWVGTQKGIAKSTDLVNWEMFGPSKDFFPYLQVTSLAEDAEGNIFIGSSSSGLFVYTKDGNWERYTWENSGLPHNEIRSLTIVDGGVWVLSSLVKPMAIPSFGAPTEIADNPMFAIQKKIDSFDPKSAISFFKY